MTTPVQIYTTTTCGYCRSAKQLLEQKQIAYEEIDVTHDEAKRNWLVATTGRRTVPQIFIQGKSIGGFDDLKALDTSGELATLIK